MRQNLNIDMAPTFYDLATNPEMFGRFADFVRIWYAHYKDGRLPGWHDFSPRDFIGWYGVMAYSEFDPGSSDPRVRYQGNTNSEYLSMDMTGRRYSEIFPQAFATVGSRYFTHLIAERCIGMLQGHLPLAGRTYKVFTAIDLPLSGDGSHVDSILTALLIVEPDAP